MGGQRILLETQKKIMQRRFAVAAMRVMLIFPVFAGWNGFLYPDLMFGSDVCRVYTAEGVEKTDVTQRELYEEVLKANPRQIRVKSRLLEFFFEFF